MNYELAKKLKDAGFPFRVIRLVREFKGDSPYLEDMQPLIPTLSELIEACGKPFSMIGFKENKYGWQAFNNIDSFCTKTGEGETPEEAVANLWLELHKNDSRTTSI